MIMVTKLKKHKLLLLHCVLLCILTVSVFMFAEEIQVLKKSIYYTIFPEPVPGATDKYITLYPVETTGEEWFADAPMIYHAGGEIHGSVYTNSREAVEETLAEGNFFIEIDLNYTSDGCLVCAHTWLDVYPTDTQPTLEEFLNSKIQGRFTPMTAADLIQIMRENPRMYLVTDIKNEDICPPMAELVALAEEDPAILDRFIIQLYTGREKSSVQEIYPFRDSQFLFTLYEWGVWQHEAAQICNEENIAVITAMEGQIPDHDVAMLRELGFTVYEHTVNRADVAKLSLARGISGFYTDTLYPEDLILFSN